MTSVDRAVSASPDDAIDHLVIRLRAYVTPAPDAGKKAKRSRGRDTHKPNGSGPSDWVLVFDCETRTTPEQRLRFGTYQLRYKTKLWEIGAFYDPDPDAFSPSELRLLRAFMARVEASFGGVRVCVRTREEFIEDVFYGCGQDVGAQIIGFNLPFDLSRLAIGHTDARRSMNGGFSLHLADGRPNVAVKHLSQRAALIHFVGLRDEAEGPESGEDAPHGSEWRANPDRGFFVDVKTLAAALISQSHSLESLSHLLPIKTKKKPAHDYNGPLTLKFIKYAHKDVQATWECFEHLNAKLADLNLVDTGAHDLYSEASLGKAYLRTMNVRPWRKVQPDFPPELIGQILSAYYGGRAEVHIRREITPVIHCDFLSMYPTVCTLMGLWDFVKGQGVETADDTETVRALVAQPASWLVELLQKPDGWSELTALVQVKPDRDLFPVRACYVKGEPATIGLNYLSSHEPQWFTLADVLVSAILAGKPPHIIRAIRFHPKALQSGLAPVTVAGRTINPAIADFYRELIIHRNDLKARCDAASEADKPALNSAQQAVKILANATSYGIFVEINPEDFSKPQSMIGYGGRGEPFKFKSKTVEKPGQYFHPLVGTLITGAARLMLALAEYQVRAKGLDWVFCDTDSIAIAKPPTMEDADFKSRALAVRDWFGALNPYGLPGSILQLEKVNFPLGPGGSGAPLDPPLCLAISAKRYVLFNRDGGGVVIRKASGHGLGHLMAPYDETAAGRRKRIERIGVPLWQEDLWKEIVRAADSDRPDETHFERLSNFDSPAASQYAATTPELLRWFRISNGDKAYESQVRPFGFMLSLQAKSRLNMAKDDPDALDDRLWLGRKPRPAAPYHPRPFDARNEVFDRELDLPIPPEWLKPISRSLARYHMHEEWKFAGAEFDQRGPLARRHVQAVARRQIGKEGDDVEESEFMGENNEPIEYPKLDYGHDVIVRLIADGQENYNISDNALAKSARISPLRLSELRSGRAAPAKRVEAIIFALNKLILEAGGTYDEQSRRRTTLTQKAKELGGRNKLADALGVNRPALGRVMSGQRHVTDQLFSLLSNLSPRTR